MPKFTYTKTKGIEQTSGSGFVISDVPITHSLNAVSTANLQDDTEITDTSQVIHLTVAANFNLKLPDGVAVGEEKLVIIAANAGSHNLIIKDSIDEWIDNLVSAKYWSAKLMIGDISEFEFKNQVVILCDDVLNSGKTLIYSSKIFLSTPLKKLSTAVLVNRDHNLYPIKSDYVGVSLSTTLKEYVNVDLTSTNKGVYLS